MHSYGGPSPGEPLLFTKPCAGSSELDQRAEGTCIGTGRGRLLNCSARVASRTRHSRRGPRVSGELNRTSPWKGSFVSRPCLPIRRSLRTDGRFDSLFAVALSHCPKQDSRAPPRAASGCAPTPTETPSPRHPPTRKRSPTASLPSPTPDPSSTVSDGPPAPTLTDAHRSNRYRARAAAGRAQM
jgi:hypothetical protein